MSRSGETMSDDRQANAVIGSRMLQFGDLRCEAVDVENRVFLKVP